MLETILGSVLGILLCILIQWVVRISRPEYQWMHPHEEKGAQKRLKTLQKMISDHSWKVMDGGFVTVINRLLGRSDISELHVFRDSMIYLTYAPGIPHLVCFVTDDLTMECHLDWLSDPKGWPSLNVRVTVVDLVGDDLKDRVTSRGMRYLSYKDFSTKHEFFNELIKE